MKTIFEQKQWISVLLVVCLLFSIMIFEASAVDKNEVESNNTAEKATVTYDDYNNYGKISSASDVDWWKVTFSSSGHANIWLGEIPSNCIYFLELYESGGSWKRAESKIKVSGQQFIKARVYAGITYFVKISSYSGYSASTSYKFRVKNYTTTQQARVYTVYDAQGNGSVNFYENASIILPYTSSMGFSDTQRHNYTSTQVYNELDDINLAVITAHGAPGQLLLKDNSVLVANTVTYGYTNYKGIGQYPASGLSDMKLLCFENCRSGVTSEIFWNLVDSSREKGAFCAIGWLDSFYHADITRWNEFFFGYLDGGDNVQQALDDANFLMEDLTPYPETITSQYYGSSSLSSLVLG